MYHRACTRTPVLEYYNHDLIIIIIEGTSLKKIYDIIMINMTNNDNCELYSPDLI